MLPNFDQSKLEQCFKTIQNYITKKIDPTDLADKKMKQLNQDEYKEAMKKIKENLQKNNEAPTKAKAVHNTTDKINDKKLVTGVSNSTKSTKNQASNKNTNKRKDQNETKHNVFKPKNRQSDKTNSNKPTKNVADSTKDTDNQPSDKSPKKRKGSKDHNEPRNKVSKPKNDQLDK